MTSHLSSPLLQGGNIEQKKEGNGFLRKVLKSSDVRKGKPPAKLSQLWTAMEKSGNMFPMSLLTSIGADRYKQTGLKNYTLWHIGIDKDNDKGNND